MSEQGVHIEWLGGNCPVQAEGTFDGVAFYFRARGTSVTVDVGDDWGWRGPEYEWPLAGWISEESAVAYINAAYEEWQGRDNEPYVSQRERKRRNDKLGVALEQHYSSAALLEDNGFTEAAEWLRERGNDLITDRANEMAESAKRALGG